MKVAMSGSQNQKGELVMAKPLKDQAFATPDKVAELVQKVWIYINLSFSFTSGENCVVEGYLILCLVFILCHMKIIGIV